MNHKESRKGAWRARIVVVVFLVVIASATWLLLRRPWMGIGTSGSHDVISLGTYRSLDACTKDVEKGGGWCGRDCRLYRQGSIADCNPLVTVPKRS
jgi:hypothetical protein